MKTYQLIFSIILLAFCTACVQKSSNKTVVVKLNVQNEKDIKSVGIRGEQRPLSWRSDQEMTAVKKDTTYTTSFSLVTGYKFAEIKFTVNGEFEFNDMPNRKIFFDTKDTTYYEATFNKLDK